MRHEIFWWIFWAVYYDKYNGWATDDSAYSSQTSPCNEQSYVASLPTGAGYFSAPGVEGGWCKTIPAADVESVRAKFNEGAWTHDATCYTKLPKSLSQIVSNIFRTKYGHMRP